MMKLSWSGKPSQWIYAHHHLAHFAGVIGLAILLENVKVAANTNIFVYQNFATIQTGVWWSMAFLFVLSIYRMLSVALWRYDLTEDRLIETSGVTPFTRRIEALELYTVIDYTLPPPGLLALFGKGSIRLTTRDPSSPTFVIRGIPRRSDVYEILRSSVERVRLSKKGYFQ